MGWQDGIGFVREFSLSGSGECKVTRLPPARDSFFFSPCRVRVICCEASEVFTTFTITVWCTSSNTALAKSPCCPWAPVTALPSMVRGGHAFPVVGEELLNIIAGRTHRPQVIEPDQVRTPLPSFHMGEQRRIGGHVHDVGIPFHSGHEGCLQEEALKWFHFFPRP